MDLYSIIIVLIVATIAAQAAVLYIKDRKNG